MRSTTVRNVAFGSLALTAAYALGASRARALVPSNPTIVGVCTDACGEIQVMTADGEVYTCNGTCGDIPITGSVIDVGNVWGGTAPTPAQRTTFGQIHSNYAR